MAPSSVYGGPSGVYTKLGPNKVSNITSIASLADGLDCLLHPTQFVILRCPDENQALFGGHCIIGNLVRLEGKRVIYMQGPEQSHI